MTEYQLQKTIFEWAEYQKNLTPPLELFHCVPNGQYRKGQRPEAGMLKGVPDTFLAFPYNGYHGLYIELKVGKNKLSDDQKKVMKMLKGVGYRVEVCYTFEEVQTLIMDDYLDGWEEIPF